MRKINAVNDPVVKELDAIKQLLSLDEYCQENAMKTSSTCPIARLRGGAPAQIPTDEKLIN